MAAKYLAQNSLFLLDEDEWLNRKQVESKVVRMDELFPVTKAKPFRPISQETSFKDINVNGHPAKSRLKVKYN